MQDCCNSSALATELLQSSTKPSVSLNHIFSHHGFRFRLLPTVWKADQSLHRGLLTCNEWCVSCNTLWACVADENAQCFSKVHDDVIKWKHFPRYWPFVRGIHRSPVNSPHKGPVTRSFDVFFELRLNKQLNKQSWGWWFEMRSRSLWRHRKGHWLSSYTTLTTGKYKCLPLGLYTDTERI